MGQKVNPKSQRLILNKDWDSRWISQKLFAYTILADNIIRSAVMEKISNAGIARIVIERGNQENKIIIHTSRPGVVIGRSGRGITDLKKYIEKKLDQSTDFKLINSQLSQKDLIQIKKKLSHNLKLSISEIREHQMHAQLVAQDIANQLEKRMPYRKVIKKTISKIESNRKINGIKIMEGRLIIPKEESVEELEKNILENDNFLLQVFDCEGKGYKIEGFARCEECGEEFEFIKKFEENLDKEINGAIILTPMNTEEI